MSMQRTGPQLRCGKDELVAQDNGDLENTRHDGVLYFWDIHRHRRYLLLPGQQNFQVK